MPTVGVVVGVRIYIHTRDHPPPHVHAEIGDAEAMISIATGAILEESLPRAVSKTVCSWVMENRDRLSDIWLATRAAEDRT